MAKLSDGRLVHMKLVNKLDSAVRKQIDAGEVTISFRWITPAMRKQMQEKTDG